MPLDRLSVMVAVLAGCSGLAPDLERSGGASNTGQRQKNMKENSHGALGGRRFLLYDVKPGEGFNLQKEIFIRAAHLAAALNAANSSAAGNTLSRWTVVLPPWCSLAHWRVRPGTAREWGAFFDPDHLNSHPGLDVVEYSEYVGGGGGDGTDCVDLVIQMETFRPNEWTPQHHRMPCSKMRAAMRVRRTEGRDWVVAEYSGNCTTMLGSRAVCLQTWARSAAFLAPIILEEMKNMENPGPEGTTGTPPPRCPPRRDVASALGSSVSPPASFFEFSVLVRHLDLTTGPYDERYYRYRELMFPAKRIRDAAEAYIKNKDIGLSDQRYIAAHVRRSDFIQYAHPDTTPSLETAAGTLKYLLAKGAAQTPPIDVVFVATDATDAEKMELRRLVPGVRYFQQDLGHPGENAAVEQWVCSLSSFFVGTQLSRFTLAIQEERDLLGVPSWATWHHFCKEQTTELCMKKNWYQFKRSWKRSSMYPGVSALAQALVSSPRATKDDL